MDEIKANSMIEKIETALNEGCDCLCDATAFLAALTGGLFEKMVDHAGYEITEKLMEHYISELRNTIYPLRDKERTRK